MRGSFCGHFCGQFCGQFVVNLWSICGQFVVNVVICGQCGQLMTTKLTTQKLGRASAPVWGGGRSPFDIRRNRVRPHFEGCPRQEYRFFILFDKKFIEY